MHHSRTIGRYIAHDFVITFLFALATIAFVVCLSFLAKLTEYIARGVPWQPLAEMLLYGMATASAISMPLGAVVSCLLVYGRLSADGEITAMRAAGMSMGAITRSTLGATLCIVLFSLYINHEVEPRGHLKRRTATALLKGVSPVELIEEGRFMRGIPGLTLYVGRKKGNRLHDIRIYDTRESDLRREIRAETGLVWEDNEGRDLVMELHNVRISPFSREVPAAAELGKWTYRVENLGRRSEYRPNEEDFRLRELVNAIRRVAELYPSLSPGDLATQRTILLYELNRRTALAFATLALVLVGVPLGIRSRRRESSIGVGISLLLFCLYYGLTTMVGSVSKLPAFHPHLLIWLPVLALGGLGAVLLRRAD